MDAAVLQAMARWPQVPRCTGWLALDQRGQWWMRNQQGPTPWPRDPHGRLDKHDAGPVVHAGLAAFIGRNYTADPQGAWYFQNGPQRVDVSLEAAPWIIRFHPDAPPGERWRTHTDQPCIAETLWLNDEGLVWLNTNLGAGLLHTTDMPELAARLDAQGTALHLPDTPPQIIQHFNAPPPAFFGFEANPG